MAQSGSEGVGGGGEVAVTAYWEALHDFADQLNALHISRGAPSYRDIARASREPKLSQAGITEFLKGRRLPQLKALMEFIRVVSAEPHVTTDPATSLDAVQEEWRSRWTHVRSLQRQAQDPLAHLKTTVKATLDQAEKDAEALRFAARDEAARIRADAEAAADRLATSAKQQADELLEHAREQAARLQAEPTRSAQAASTELPSRRRSYFRRAAVAAALVLAVGTGAVGGVLFDGQRPGDCRSTSNATLPSAVSATSVRFQLVGGAVRDQAGRVPVGWGWPWPTATGWHLPAGTSAAPSTPDSASASSPASAGSSASASPTHPTDRPSAGRTSSAQGCR
ncbi:hypothetical protein [Streptomyces sp. NPDC096012]|uniref:hypothetical protein n=1 Tax=Streptomyces sp. NPDC096012 TaxID=3155684 RepID=UPI00336A46BD